MIFQYNESQENVVVLITSKAMSKFHIFQYDKIDYDAFESGMSSRTSFTSFHDQSSSFELIEVRHQVPPYSKKLFQIINSSNIWSNWILNITSFQFLILYSLYGLWFLNLVHFIKSFKLPMVPTLNFLWFHLFWYIHWFFLLLQVALKWMQ